MCGLKMFKEKKGKSFLDWRVVKFYDEFLNLRLGQLICLCLSLCCCLFLGSCEQESFSPEHEEFNGQEVLSHEMIELGEKLEDPYEVENVKRALASLYGTKAEMREISATNRYVRFLPESEDDFNKMLELGVEMLEIGRAHV